MRPLSFSFIIISLLLLSCSNHYRFPYQDPELDFESRSADLVSRMTLEEKVGQLTYEAAAVEHLGIPEYNWWNECLHGVARSGRATVFPQAIGMAASFDRDMICQVADVISTEARAKYNTYSSLGKRGIYQGLTFWSPNINIFRDPRWGRGQETYGEDPFLTGELGVQFIRGLQGTDPRYLKVVATSKHYVVHSGPESLRHEFEAEAGERDFRDTYLPAFRKTVEEGGVYSVMCAFNSYRGAPCCGSIPLEEELLRGELGFRGYIVSDCGAIFDFHTGHNIVKTPVEAAARGIISGTDLNCGDQYRFLVRAVEMGLVSEEEINRSVRRLMLARMKLGMFDPPEMVPWSGISRDTIACEAHRALAVALARKSIVLLKNEHTLPLGREIRKIAVIGPNADNTDVQNGNYNGTPVDPVSVYQAVRHRLGNQAEVRYAQGSPHHEGLPFLVPVPADRLFVDPEGKVPGLEARFFNNLEAQGDPVARRTDPVVDFQWWDGAPPVEGLEDDRYSVEWTGYLIPGRTGRHSFGVEAKYFDLLFEGDTLITFENIHRPHKLYRELELKAGRPYRIRLVLRDRHGDTPCVLHWEEPDLPLVKEALEAAAWADHVILVMGLSGQLEGEEMRGLELEGFSAGDRTSLDLPEVQRDLIRRITGTGKPVTMVLMTGSAVSLGPETERIPGILQAWYGGEAAGTAVADVLFGDYNPAGRLPVTFYRSAEDLPPFEDYSMAGRTYRYFRGEVQYPFGYGLSYTDFDYDNLLLEKKEITAGDSLLVSVEVTNKGAYDGEEVVQMYIRRTGSDSIRPLKDLRGFERVFIKRGQTRVVIMQLGPGELSSYDTDAAMYRVEKGLYEIQVGPSSADDRLISTTLTVR